MKRIILFLSIFFILTGCVNNNDGGFDNEDGIKNNLNEIDTENITEIDSYVDDNPIKVALYDGNYKITSYSTTLSNFKDIGVFNVYYTDVQVLESSSSRDLYPKYYNQYENIDGYKTGFYITFEADGNKIEQLILDPSSKHAMTPYLYVYLYDDVNQVPGAYYSHLEPEDMKENTIFSSIKLFLAQQGSKISSPITLTVFTYDGDEDFDEFNRYRGISSYTVTIDIN